MESFYIVCETPDEYEQVLKAIPRGSHDRMFRIDLDGGDRLVIQYDARMHMLCDYHGEHCAEGKRYTFAEFMDSLTPEPKWVDVMPVVDGKRFRCECGCNVFHHFNGNPNQYECNACSNVYEGEEP